MKTFIKTIILSCILSFAFVACEKDEIMTFEGDDGIYFKWAKDGRGIQSAIDSTSLTFAFSLPSMVSDSLVNIPIKIQGHSSSKDRLVNIKVKEESTMQEGVHFKIPEEIFVLADSIVGYIPVTFYRTEDMKIEPLSLKLRLLENENFKVNLYGEAMSFNADRPVKYNEFEFTVSDILVEPIWWSRILVYYLGDFSAKKMYLFAEVNEIPLPNWNDNPPDIMAFFNQLDIFKVYLLKQEADGTPVLDENGEPMKLGPFA